MIQLPRGSSVPSLSREEGSFENHEIDPEKVSLHKESVEEYEALISRIREEKMAYYIKKHEAKKSGVSFSIEEPEKKKKKRGPKLDEDVIMKICDMGNGCWTFHHFTSKIQTRQYRSPETIIGIPYSTSADNWSFACMIFEMITGDFLFEPRSGSTYLKDDDHLAQMIELLGPPPRHVALAGKLSKKFFEDGKLKRIKGLHYWPLKKVMMEKYKFLEKEAVAFSDFLTPLLHWDQEQRMTAQEALSHPWLKMRSTEETKMEEKAHSALMLKKKLREIDDDDSTRPPSEDECEADIEDNPTGVDSLDDDESDSDFEVPHENELFTWSAQRNISAGIQINNSFSGPYPANFDGLHNDRGKNYQFVE